MNAKELLKTGCGCAALSPAGDTVCESGRGVAPLIKLCAAAGERFVGCDFADRVMGRAAAALALQLRPASVWAQTISDAAVELLESNGVKVSWQQRVPHILNAERSDWCPLEKTLDGCTDAAECRRLIGEFRACMAAAR